MTVETHDLGLEIAGRYGFSIYDAMIAASALHANCKILYSQDLSYGKRIDKRLTVRNPFAAA